MNCPECGNAKNINCSEYECHCPCGFTWIELNKLKEWGEKKREKESKNFLN